MRKITLLIAETYNSEGMLSDGLDEMEVNPYNLPDILFDESKLSARELASSGQKKLVISFPNGDAETIMVEIYNGYRE